MSERAADNVDQRKQEEELSTISKDVAERLGQRALRCRRTGMYYLVMVCFVFILTTGMFIFSEPLEHLFSNDLGLAELNKALLKTNEELTQNQKQPPNETQIERVNRLLKVNELETQKRSINDNIVDLIKMHKEKQGYLANIIGRVILTFGAVLLSVLIIQMLVSLMRYHVRYAQHYEMIADIISLSQGDSDRLKIVREALMPIGMEFGPEIASPYDKALEVARDAVGKLPMK